MYPLNALHIKVIERFLRNNPGRTVTQFQGFKETGIYPFHEDIFTDAASGTTDQQGNEGEKTVEKTVNATQELEKENRHRNLILEKNLKEMNNEKKNEPEIPNQGKNDKNREPQDVSIPTSFRNIVDVEPSRPSPSGFDVSPIIICPISRSSRKRCNTGKRCSTAIISSSPYKNEFKS
ncbi:hypothetical protein JTB14_019059 [Gonioctena quinquepunctata]|nr:hypothetical protein JTB14_019059 [Gonioctena quinquepunctata]